MSRTLCLTLPETPERTAGARKHFADMGVEGVEYVDGICAKSFGVFTTHPYLHDDPKRGGCIIPQQQVGCMLSHYLLWSACRLLNEERVFILEDDAEFPVGWQERLARALADTPADADLLFVGSCCTADKPKTLVRGEVWEVKWPLATHAYVVWRKALPVLLETQRDVYAPVDLALYFKTLPRLRVYTVLPRIVSQRGTELHP